jgi:cyclopropane fatty-acyl-phospholipid synthase-like methyltransferase
MIHDEHFVPTLGLSIEPYVAQGDVGGVHHLLRYAWARKVLERAGDGLRILEVACGAGYGSFMLASAFPGSTFVALDYDEKAVSSAREAYDLPNLRFDLGDVCRWQETIGDESYDCVVSFDTLEHVEHREVFLQNVAEHLAPGGLFLLSTPCGSNVTELKPEWEFHRIEYSSARLYDFLRRYFATILRPDDGTLPEVAVFDQLQGTGIDYLLRLNPVVCRDAIVIDNPYPGRECRTR